MVNNQKKIQHLLWRAGFSPSFKQLSRFQDEKQAAEKLFSDAAHYTLIKSGDEDEPGVNWHKMSPDEKKANRKMERQSLRGVVMEWFQKMFDDENALREKMTLFWHSNLACRTRESSHARAYVNVLHEHALGKFGDLIKAVSKTPAMMTYLNAVRNKKGSPNENFARELMELFTLGKGHYTEQDVKEAARAFTGWSILQPDGFRIIPKNHDSGVKTIFGKSGNFDGDDVLNMILENKQTARNITRKVYSYFVNDEVNDEVVSTLSEKFYSSGYDINQLMKQVFTSSWFYDEKNIGIRIKSPVELVVGITRQLDLQYENFNALQAPQRIMGQELMMPPNVAGWPGGKNWIDSSSLMYRLNFGGVLLGNSNYDLSPKIQPEEMLIDSADVRVRVADKDSVWKNLSTRFNQQSKEELIASVHDYLIQSSSKVPVNLLQTIKTDDDDFLKNATLTLLSTPEYQMC